MRSRNGDCRWQGRTVSRRGLLRAAGGAAIGSAGLALVGCDGGDERGSASPVATPEAGRSSGIIGPVEQQKQRRLGTGLTAWDPSQTYDGYTLFSPMGGASAYLIDMEGEIVHNWTIAELTDLRNLYWVYLLENGNLLCIGHMPAGDAPTFVFKGGFVMEVDWDSKVLWQLDDPAQHHDARLLPNGNLLLLCTELVPPEVAARVQGGLAGTGEEGMWCDWVKEATREGEVVWEWHAWEHLDLETDRINWTDLRYEWTHANSVEQSPDGNVLISFRNINTVGIVDRQSGEFVWKFGPPELAQQHNPSCLPNGNILIFDNGAHRLNVPLPYSRVIEVDPETSEIVWQYADRAPLNFFSPYISGCQRLPNGNTLITEGNFGRLFEVTTEGQVVWEYISPFFGEMAIFGETNQTFRAHRYAAEAFPRLQT
jgi:hypothetical protein